MGKHDASRHARGSESKKAPKALIWVLLGVVIVAAVAVVLVCTGAFRPAEVNISAMGEETVERPAVEGPEEAAGEEAPEEDGAAQLPQDGPEEAPGEEVTREESVEAGPVEEEQVAGEFAPELEILPEDGGLTAEEYAAGETMAAVNVSEYTTWLTAGEGESYHMYVQDKGFSVAVTEFITRGDTIVTSAESTYTSVAGMDDAVVEGIAQGFTSVLPTGAKEGDAELLWERQEDWLVLVTILRDLDDPANLAYYGDAGLMRIVDGDTYSLTEAEEFLLELGYQKQ